MSFTAISQAPIVMLLVTLGAGFAAGLLSNWAADTLPRLGADVQPPGSSAAAPHPLRRRAVVAGLVLLFAVLAWHHYADLPRLLVNWFYAWFFVTVLVIDLETRRVLNIMLLPAALIALAAGLWLGDPSLGSMIGGAVIALVLFGALYLFGRFAYGRGALGLGDVKLVAVIGLMTGYPNIMQALVIGATLGGVAAFFLLATRRAGWKSTCAYAPYLAVGAMLALWTQIGG